MESGIGVVAFFRMNRSRDLA